MAARTFQDRFTPDWPLFIAIRRVILCALAVHIVLASLSGYRAWVQVGRLDLSIDHSPTLHPGDWAHLSIESSGRVWNDVVLELIQGSTRRVLAAHRMPMNENFFYDPRSQHAEVEAQLTGQMLSGFAAGPAIIRASGFGGSQFLRVPPPVVSQLAVTLAR
jgi:hypothetical protein